MILLDQAGAASSTTTLLATPPPLQPFVEHFWVQRQTASRSTPLAWRIVPDANPYLIFTVSGSASRGTTSRCMLVGPRSRFLDISVAGRVFTCGARLRPGVLPFLTHLPASEFVDRTLPVEETFGLRGMRLLEALGESWPWGRAAERMAIFLYKGLIHGGSFQSFPVHSVASVLELAHSAGLATRTLHRRVTQTIGLQPKLWLRIERMHRAIATSINDGGSWRDVAMRCGFADQAHMIREFIDLLGESPTAWMQRALSHPPSSGSLAANPGI